MMFLVGNISLPPTIGFLAANAARALGVVPADQEVAYDLKPETDVFSELGLVTKLSSHFRGGLTGWGRYVGAVAGLLRERGRPAAGLDGTISSTLPAGAGLSSSAALSVAVALALCEAARFELPRLDGFGERSDIFCWFGGRRTVDRRYRGKRHGTHRRKNY